jgi:hypothetical protein
LVCALAQPVPADDSTEFAGVNAVRAQAGLPPLHSEPRLARAARSHAAYLDRHREPGKTGQGVSAHAQEAGREGFSGATPAARALAAGYPQRDVLENVSMGYDSPQAALDGLMSAIYHRLTFLDFEADQVGIGVGENSRVFLLGRSDFAALCENPPPDAIARPPIDCLGQVMKRSAYDALCAALPADARFAEPHPFACANGRRLDAAYMRALCADPPPGARFPGHGRYYQPCTDGTRILSGWFDTLCAAPPAAARYPYSGEFFEICDDPVRVHAAWLEQHCADLPDADRYTDSGRYLRPCAEPHDIRAELLDDLERRRREPLPLAVTWPVDGAVGVPPAFFLEEPDPLPDRDVSGYPLSVQFNPARVGRVEDVAFALQRIDGAQPTPVQDWLLLDRDSDPNGLLTALEFAFFPLQRLAWGAHYEARLSATVDGEPLLRTWRFRTAGAGTEVLRLDGGRQRFALESGRDYLLYLPPAPDESFTVLNTELHRIRANRVDIRFVDPNTLRVRLDATWCVPSKIRFDHEREAVLVPAGCPG